MSVTKFLHIFLTVAGIPTISAEPENEIHSFQASDIDMQKSVAQCILNIAKKYFPLETNIGMISSNFHHENNSHNVLAIAIMAEMRWSISMKDGNRFVMGKSKLISGEKIHNYIIMLTTEAEVVSNLRMLSQTESWDPHRKFLVFVNWVKRDWRSFTLFIFEQFRAYSVIDILICIPTSDSGAHTKIITWRAYTEVICNDDTVLDANKHILELAECHNSQIIPANVNLFPEKVPRNLNGCEVNIMILSRAPLILSFWKTKETIELLDPTLPKGIEINLITTMAQKWNFRPIYYSASTKIRDDFVKGPSNSSETITLDAKFAIVIGGIAVQLKYEQSFDHSVSYSETSFTCIVSNIDVFPHWYGLIHIFKSSVWLAGLIFCIFVCWVIWLMAKYASNETSMYSEMHRIVLNNMQFMVGTFPSAPPRTPYIRCVVLLWSFFCLHWFSAYTGSLISMITFPLHRIRYRTMDDVLNAGIPIGKSAFMHDFKRIRNGNAVNLNLVVCENILDCFARIVENPDNAMISSRIYFEFILANYTNVYGEPMLRTVPDDLMSVSFHLLTKKGFPLLGNINKSIRSITEAGLIGFWTKNVKERLGPTISRERNPLNWEHLEGAFYVMAMGSILSFIVFCVEHCVVLRKKLTGRRFEISEHEFSVL